MYNFIGIIMFTNSIYMADMADIDSSGYDIVQLRLSHPLTETAMVYVSILDEGTYLERFCLLYLLSDFICLYANRLE